MTNLSREQIQQLYSLAGDEMPENPSSEDISRVLIEIEKRISPEYASIKASLPGNANILMVDDMELSLYQLGKVLTSCGYNIVISRSVEEALDYYKKQNFQYVVADLFLPDPENGLELIETIHKSEKAAQNNTKIIVISGSDDNKLIEECFRKGANEFINKSPDWHKKVLQHIGTLESHKLGLIMDIMTKIEDNDSKIASLTVNNINRKDVQENLKKEIQMLVKTGFVNIIFDFGKAKSIDQEGLNIIVYAYKSCTEAKGAIKLCGVSEAMSESLSYVFLNNLIQVFTDKEFALSDFKKENALK